MKKAVALGAYLTVSVAVFSSVLIGLTRLGVSIVDAVILAYLASFLFNGTLTYGLRAHRLKAEGRSPPSFLKHLFPPMSLSSDIRIPRSVRAVLGIAVALGGCLFLLFGAIVVLAVNFADSPHQLGYVVFLLAMVTLAACLGYLGIRLITLKDGDSLFRRSRATGNATDNAA